MSKLPSQQQYWAVIPAAGVGKRMQASRPKQYLSLHGKMVFEHTLDRLLSIDEIKGAIVSISATDDYWPELGYQSAKPVLAAEGGQERSDSVLNALKLLKQQVENTETVWVLVHDAARPCVRSADIQQLMSVASDEDGGLLALPVRDTMKREGEMLKVDHTVDRGGLWHALTPQMFRLDILLNALNHAANEKLAITDDASAMELAGYRPKLVEAHEDNIKITRPFDLQLAELFLAHQSSS